MNAYLQISAIFAGLVFFLQIYNKDAVIRFRRWLVPVAVFLIIAVAGYSTYRLFHAWQVGPVTRFLLPPHQPWSYFISYAFSQYLERYCIAITGTLIFMTAAWFINKRSGERFLYNEEVWLLGTGMFLSGHPGWLVYVVLLMGSSTIANAIYRITVRENRRLSLYYFWMPVSLVTMFAMNWLMKISFVGVLKI